MFENLALYYWDCMASACANGDLLAMVDAAQSLIDFRDSGQERPDGIPADVWADNVLEAFCLLCQLRHDKHLRRLRRKDIHFWN